MKYFKTILFTVCFSISYSTFAFSFEDAKTIDAKITFQKLSHQNPWLIGEPYSKRISLIHVGGGKFLGLTSTKQNPVYAEFDTFDFTTPKLSVEAYDSETGFILLVTPETRSLPKPVYLSQSKACNQSKSRYVTLPNSKTPMKVFLLGEDAVSEPNFYFKNNNLCGIVFLDFLIPIEYLKLFLQSGGKGIPHPGWIFDPQLTVSEKEYYSNFGAEGILVSEVVPGVGPAYNLFPGDLVISIQGKRISEIPEFDRVDRLYDLILRKPDGSLKSIGDKITVQFQRERSQNKVSYELRAYDTNEFLIPDEANNRRPVFLILGGFFFTELTQAYLKEFGSDYKSKSEKKLVFLSDYYQKKVHPVREKIVILSRVFPLQGNLGYQDFQDLILERVNGIRITSLSQLKELVNSEKSSYFAMEFSGGKIAFFSRKELVDLESDLQQTYRLGRSQNISD